MELIRRDYVANNGWETFLSYEDPEQGLCSNTCREVNTTWSLFLVTIEFTDILVGLLRLRKCSEETFRPELKGGVSVVRELHVYGSVVPINARDPSKFQHQVLHLHTCTNRDMCTHAHTI